MTVWDKIYQDYKNGGEEYATLKKGLIPEFLEFINNHDFKLKKVLDVGCGNGKYLVFLKTLGFEVNGIDSSPTAVEMTKESLGTSQPKAFTKVKALDNTRKECSTNPPGKAL